MSPPKTRLTAKLRKESIAQSVLPLFARKGLKGVTTVELAKSCGVSEALIFRHFPTKAALYNEMLRRYSYIVEPLNVRLDNFPPSTETLVRLVFSFVYRIVVNESTTRYPIMRLFYRSFVDDGAFACQFLRSKRVRVIRHRFEASLTEARRCNDALPMETEPYNLFWFVQHTASMACLIRLAPKRAMTYRGPLDAAVMDMVRFTLRGVGLTEAAMKQHATDDRFAKWIKDPSV
jgi:TetR/AcrR family transcriptional regulator, transcriptional repressor of aconitase